ncbi:MAG: hypothetical protein HZA08_09595 [Nitrospirae bacterium]|nr:hypothetical protein [Nitrospirota bacterium]
MLCRQRTGSRTEAIRAYKRLKTFLSTHLGIEPSAETEAIHKLLLKR